MYFLIVFKEDLITSNSDPSVSILIKSGFKLNLSSFWILICSLINLNFLFILLKKKFSLNFRLLIFVEDNPENSYPNIVGVYSVTNWNFVPIPKLKIFIFFFLYFFFM